ncbi:MAG TPA: biopolymer transporter ExbD [Verrucomicrobiae bacterium]|nr:biopolymer transporter ExbD [Verrucomicrobiae bacterium]
MRRFSQRNSLVTLNDINITPLLDLAFVLLIIFVITTPLLEKGLDISLPSGSGQADKELTKNDIRTVDITSQGLYAINRRTMQLNQVISQLAQEHKSNPNLVVYIRADGNSHTKDLTALMDACTQSGLTRYSIRETPQNQR